MRFQVYLCRYTCGANRKVIHRDMLSAGNDSDVTDSVSVTCSGETGRFEPSLSDVTCTVPCPIPTYDTNLMVDDWDRRTSVQPQYQASDRGND